MLERRTDPLLYWTYNCMQGRKMNFIHTTAIQALYNIFFAKMDLANVY
jgi:hypothetical protein